MEESCRQFLQTFTAHRQRYKDILLQQRALHDARKQLDAARTKEAKIQKTIDAVRRKGDTAKLTSLQAEHQRIRASVNHCLEDYSRLFYVTEEHKAKSIREALCLLSDAHIGFARQTLLVFEAQKELALLIPAEQPHLTTTSVYQNGPKQSDAIVTKAVKHLRMETFFARLPIIRDPQAKAIAAVVPKRAKRLAVPSRQDPVADEEYWKSLEGDLLVADIPGILPMGLPLQGCLSLRSAAAPKSADTPPLVPARDQPDLSHLSRTASVRADPSGSFVSSLL
eukprot:m.324351 g.324351  ORF g.324351 m.324351 type:complete len:281 (-) comp55538_c0_seq9:1162-2004(-)